MSATLRKFGCWFGVSDDRCGPPFPATVGHRRQRRLLYRSRRQRAGVELIYYGNEPGPRTAANLLTRDEARRIAANIARLPDFLGAEQRQEGNTLLQRRP
jgi:hypothetical protein